MNRKRQKSPLSQNLVISRLGKSQEKVRERKIPEGSKKKRITKILSKEQVVWFRHQRQNVSDCRVQETSYWFLNHHNASREMSARIRIVELRTEEHHGEWAGTKYFEPKNPFFLKKNP